MERKSEVGDVVLYVDKEGNEHNALIIHFFPTCVNLVYVEPDPIRDNDSFGNARRIETSVPWRQGTMSAFYVTYPR